MPLIVLDRDGVINLDSDAYIKSDAEWHPLDGAIAAIVQLQQAGYDIAIATNQSGIGRGYYDEAMLAAMHQKMNRLIMEAGGIAIEVIAYCPHHPDAGCDCRKPKPGLLDQIAQRTGYELAEQILVGDSLRDLQAGAARAMQLYLVRTGKGQKTARAGALPSSTQVVASLHALAQQLLAK